jgi:hypothetical protein
MSKADQPYGDPESMDRGQLTAKLDELGVPFDASASDDRLRSSLREAPKLVAERGARLEAEGAGTAQPPAPSEADKT